MTELGKVRLKFASRELLKYGANAAAEFDDPDWPRFVRITDITEFGQLKDSTFRSLPPEVAEEYLLESGDLLLARSGSIGRSFIYQPEWGVACFAGYLIRARLKDEFDPRFVYWALNSSAYWGWIESIAVRSTIQNVSAERYADYEIPAPPLEAQQRIARFLDEKTARIDALIAKKRALLERLAEKRRALITRAVIKGLNPAVPMRSSGIDWLGEIPAHWEVKRLRYSMTKIEQGWSPQCNNYPAEPGEWGVLKVGCVNGERYDETENKSLPSEIDPLMQYEVIDGDILVSRANTKELLGGAALVEHTQGRIIFSDKLYRLHLRDGIDPKYIIGVLRSSLARFQYEREATGTSGSMQNIGQDTIKNLIHPLPPEPEQHQIGIWVAREKREGARLDEKQRAAISKLEEYRAALITAAVTGQIAELN